MWYVLVKRKEKPEEDEWLVGQTSTWLEVEVLTLIF